MRENTPPHRPDFDDADDDYLEEILLDGDPPLDDDNDDLEMEEVTLAQLEARLGLHDDDDDDDDELDPVEAEIQDHERIAAIKDEAVCTFRKHTAPIFGCSLHPKLNWAATGSEDDRAFVWNVENGDVLFEITDHKDTVTEVHFSHDGSYLATADISGEVFVYKVSEEHEDRPILTKVWEYSMFDMAWMFWHRAANVLFAGGDSGEVFIWRIPSGECKILPGQSIRCEAGALNSDGKKLFTVYLNGVLKLWDIKSCQVHMEVTDQHPLGYGSITHAAVTCSPELPLYVCAEGNGRILFCTGNGPVNTIRSEHGIECIAFAPATATMKLLACGALEGHITIWDTVKYTLRSFCDSPIPNDGVLRVKWLNDNTLIASTTQGNLNVFDARTGDLKFTMTGHHYHIYEFVYKPEENLLLTVSEDSTAKIFKVPPLGE